MKKVSVLIVAHNEEKYIKRCIDSLIGQTEIPNEIVLIAHNCTDKTEEIAKNYKEVRVVPFQGPKGVVYARMYGFKEVAGEIIACIDGDAYAEDNWLEEIIKPLMNTEISGVGTVVFYYGSIFSGWASFNFFYLRHFMQRFFGKFGKFYFFGPSFAVRKNDYTNVGGLEPFIELKKKLPLINWPDDCYLSLALWKQGEVVLVNKPKTKVFAVSKNKGFHGVFIRPFEQMIDGYRLYNFFNKLP